MHQGKKLERQLGTPSRGSVARTAFRAIKLFEVLHGCSKNGKSHKITMMAEMIFASLVVFDELHTAGNRNTQTYTHILELFQRMMSPESRPAVIGITGSPLASGIDVVMTFADKALRREDAEWKKSNDGAIEAIKHLNTSEIQTAWKEFDKRVRLQATTTKKISVKTMMDEDEKMQKLLRTFGYIIGTYGIDRNHESVDPWAKPLRLLDLCELNVQYCALKYDPDHHRTLQEVEDGLKTKEKEANEQAKLKWEDEGGILSGKPKPKPKNAAQLDAAAYNSALKVASFPNIFKAIRKYQEDHPDRPVVIGATVEWGDSLGNDNKMIHSIVDHPESIQSSWIVECIDDIIEGSAKMDMIFEAVNRAYNEKSAIPHPDEKRHRGEQLVFRSKYCLGSSNRLEKAIVYCALGRTYGYRNIAFVSGNGKK
ncbi:unnamed protein product [Periconia digitata]|uniref:Uncharacterized protein n=1 Tax=Periconia digitata TaxID=1303443 RepID=A0A9W4UNJ8_9PLEO|nr:unnamed protein product [Periconia digitata]